MKVGDLVRNMLLGDDYGQLGLVMEKEKYEGETGAWVWYPENDGSWRWYSFDQLQRFELEVTCESG